MSSKINLQTCEYACKSSIFQDNQLISAEKIPVFCDFFVCFQLSKVVAFNAEWLYNVLEHKTESEDCHMTRQDYINAILKLLEKADFRQLRLVWVYASHLIG